MVKINMARLLSPELTEIVGEAAVPVVNMLSNGTALSELDLAKKASMDINSVRTLLYRLHENNLVNFRREREKKSGWYIYYWSFNKAMVKPLIANLRKQKLLRLREELKREDGGTFFACERLCVRMDFDTTTNCRYRCPECGGVLQPEDNIEKIRKLKAGIVKLEKAIAAV